MLETTPIRSGSPFSGARSVSQLDDRSSLAPPSRSSMVQTASAVRELRSSEEVLSSWGTPLRR